MLFSEWANMCPHRITVERYLGVDAYGAYTYGPPTSYPARIQGKTQFVANAQGEELVSHVTIYLGTLAIGAQDRITLPAPFTPTVPSILDVQYVSDESGAHHTVVLA